MADGHQETINTMKRSFTEERMLFDKALEETHKLLLETGAQNEALREEIKSLKSKLPFPQ